jgi:hypothetical protein
MLVRAAQTLVALFVVAVVGVTAALAAAAVVGHVSPMVVEFAYGWCTVPALVLALVAYGGVHAAERLWPVLASGPIAAVAARVRGRLRTARGKPRAVSSSSSFHTAVRAPRAEAPSPVLLGVVVAVPLAFLNLPGWLAVGHVVDGSIAGGIALFVVPGTVCGALTGALIAWQRSLAAPSRG